MALSIEVTCEFEAIAIWFNGLLHIWIDRPKLLAVNSWKQTTTQQFFIEFIMQDGKLITDYDTQEKWETILKKLAVVLLPSKRN